MIGNLVQYFRRALAQPTVKSRRRPDGRNRVRLAVETLEDRFAPAVVPLVAASFFDGAVYKFDANTGALLQTLVAPNQQATLQGPAGMTAGPDGNLYFSSQFNNRIVKLDHTTNQLSTFIPSTVLNPIAQGNGLSTFSPTGLRFGPDGNLYVSLNGGQQAQGGGAVVRFDITNTAGVLSFANTFQKVADNLVQPTELTFGNTPSTLNTLYVSNSAAGNVVKVENADGATPVPSVFITAGAGGLIYPTGVVWGPAGKLYVVDLAATGTRAGAIFAFNPDGTFIKILSSPSNALLKQFPSDLVFTTDGRFLTANLGPTYPQAFGGPGTAGSIFEFITSNGKFNSILSASAFPATMVGNTPVTNFSPSQLTLDAGNHAPVASAGTMYAINEGNSLALHATATDADGNPLTFSWDINGDGKYGDATGANPVLSYSYLTTLGVSGAGTFDVKVIARDNHGGMDVSAAVPVTINHLAPTVKIGGPTKIFEAANYVLSLAGKASIGHVITGWTINWGDGQTSNVGNVTSANHAYAAGPNNYTITATAIDDVATVATANTVNVAVFHKAPALTLSGINAVNEGANYVLNLNTVVTGAHVVSKITINWGDGTALQEVAGNATTVNHTYARGPAKFAIVATATDDVSTYKALNFVKVGVTHVAPVLNITGAAAVTEGSPFVLNLGATVTAGHAIKSYRISWGDGMKQSVLGTATTVTHTYYATAQANRTIVVSATDDVGTYLAPSPLVVQVNHQVPILNIIGSNAGQVGQLYTLNLSGTEPLPQKHFIKFWTIVWGDGKTTVVKGNPMSVQHIYTTAGPFNITAAATDDVGTFPASAGQQVTIS